MTFVWKHPKYYEELKKIKQSLLKTMAPKEKKSQKPVKEKENIVKDIQLK